MAVLKRKVAGCDVKIHNVDHPPPHCHVLVDGRDLRVHLYTLAVLNPPPHDLPPKVRQGLRKVQEDLLQAWEEVRVSPPGSSPGSHKGGPDHD